MTIQSQATRAASVRLAAAALAVGGAALLAACSSSGGGAAGTATPATRTSTPSASPSTSPSTTATASAATCKHVASLRNSLESLTHVQLNASASGKIRTNLTNIQTQLHALKTEGSGTLSTQVNQLSAAVDKVTKAAQGVTANPSAPQIQAIITALGGLKTTSASAAAELKAKCPQS